MMALVRPAAALRAFGTAQRGVASSERHRRLFRVELSVAMAGSIAVAFLGVPFRFLAVIVYTTYSQMLYT